MREAKLEYGLFIGINGCSLKTQDNLDVVKAVPLDRIILETGEFSRSLFTRAKKMIVADLAIPHVDAPWCSITTTAASHAYVPKHGPYTAVEKTKTLKAGGETGVKGRNEPADVSLDEYRSYEETLIGSDGRSRRSLQSPGLLLLSKDCP